MPYQENKLRIGYLSTVYHTSFILQGTDTLQALGIQAEWTLYPSGPDIVNAMREGNLDLGYIGLPPVIIGIDRGVDLRCVAGGHIEGTVVIAGEEWKALGECSGIPDFLSQFEGTAIGCPPKGSIHDVIVNDLLRRHGMDGIRVINYPWADFIPDALLSGEISAAAGTPALAVTARRYADARIVVPADAIWPYNPSYGIVTAGETIGNAALLSRFLRAHEEACEFIRHDPYGAARIVSEVTEMVDPGFVMETYRISPKYCASLTGEYIASTMTFVEALAAAGYISGPIPEKRIFDTTLIDEVHRSPAHYDAGLNLAP